MAETDIHKLFHRCRKALAHFIPAEAALERALNLCLVMENIRPACLWYIDPDYEKSIAFLDTVDTNELQYTVGLGKIPLPIGDEEEELAIPHTLILRTDNQVALQLAGSAEFANDIFASHKKLGKALGYFCAGDEPTSKYHVRLTGTLMRPHKHFIVMEQMCKERHREQFREFAQQVQNFCDRHELGIQLDLFTADRESGN